MKTKYEVIGKPQIEHEYSDEYETAMVIKLRRNDGVEGDVWIVAGVPDYLVSMAQACGSERGLAQVWAFGDSPDHWCPASFDVADWDAIEAAVHDIALAAHREYVNQE